MPKIKINDINLYYETHGSGEPIVFIGGFSVDHTVWTEMVQLLKHRYQIILLDNRGAGQTDVPRDAYSLEQMAADVVALCAKLGINKAHFVGNSMGGHIVQLLAFKHKELVKSAIISNSSMNTHCVFHVFLEAQLTLMKAKSPLVSLIHAVASWLFSYRFLSQLGVLQQFIQLSLANPYPFTIEGFEGQGAALKQFDSQSWAKKISVPVLVIGADQDIIFSEPTVKALANEIPEAKYYGFKECGHLPFIEFPKEFAEVVSGFIDAEVK